MVQLERSHYFSKIESVVKEGSKFIYLGPANKYDKTAPVEVEFNNVFKELRDKTDIIEEVYMWVISTQRVTAVPLEETMKICAYALFDIKDPKLSLSN